MSVVPSKSSIPPARRLTRGVAGAYVLKLIRDHGDDFSAVELLKQHPELREHPSCVIDLAYEDYCRQRERGEAIAADEFVQNFHGVEQSLFRVIEIDQVLHDHPSLVENVPEERWPVAGGQFLDFELNELIGRGALSRVFTATQTDLGRRRVVLKICLRGQREADFMGKLEHEGIAPVHSVHPCDDTGLTGICMPLLTLSTLHTVTEALPEDRNSVTGTTVRNVVISQNSSDADTDSETSSVSGGVIRGADSFQTALLHWGIQLSRALSFAHSRGVLHCDVKPGNVLIHDDLSASLLDFNLAWSTDDVLRVAGGTLPFMASEQLRQLLPAEDQPVELTGRTDVFGLCATLWHVAAGAPPFGECVDQTRVHAAEELLHRQAQGISDDRIRNIRNVLSASAVGLLLKGLSVDPENRFEDAEELASALEGLLPRRRRRQFLLAAGILLTSSVGFAWHQSVTTRNVALQRAVTAAVDFIHRGQMNDAREQIASHTHDNALCRFLDVYCRTCLLSPPGKDRSEWETVIAEWNEIATGPYKGFALHNLAFVHLEFCDAYHSTQALDLGQKASAAGISSAALERYLRIGGSDQTTSPTNLGEMISAIASDGSRGEFYVCLNVLNRRLRDPHDSDSLQQAISAAVAYEAATMPLIEPATLANLAAGPDTHKSLLDAVRRAIFAHRGEAVPSRLSRVLILPQHSGGNLIADVR